MQAQALAKPEERGRDDHLLGTEIDMICFAAHAVGEHVGLRRPLRNQYSFDDVGDIVEVRVSWTRHGKVAERAASQVTDTSRAVGREKTD